MGLEAGSACIINSVFTITDLKQDKISEDPQMHGAMLIPIILSSDKTTVSVATGHNEYYPLYLSIGNVRNSVRHAHHNVLALVAFLAIPCSKSDYLVALTAILQAQRTRNTPTMRNFANFIASFSTHHSQRSFRA